MLRAAIVVGLLVGPITACSARSGGPKWPKQHEPEADGGESIAPRPSVATVEDDGDSGIFDLDVKPVEKTDKPAEKPKAATTPETPKGAAPTAPEEPITTEEIVIEIDD